MLYFIQNPIIHPYHLPKKILQSISAPVFVDQLLINEACIKDYWPPVTTIDLIPFRITMPTIRINTMLIHWDKLNGDQQWFKNGQITNESVSQQLILIIDY